MRPPATLLAKLAAPVAVLAALLVSAAGAEARSRGAVQVLALVPAPGFPALPHVLGNHIFEGTYDDPAGDSMPSRVLEYTAGGELLNSWTVMGHDVRRPHGVQVAANDSRGLLLLLDKTSGRIIRLDPHTGSQTLYSRVPDLPACTSAAAGATCSPALLGHAPPDYAAWGPDGSLHVTDYQQAVIWRIPPGGGAARIWLADRRLDGGPFGTACIVLMPDHHTLLFDQASNAGLGGGDPAGKLYEVPIEPGDRPGALQQLWESGPADAPTAARCRPPATSFVALAGESSRSSSSIPPATSWRGFGQQYTGTNNSTIPFDTPSGLAF